MNGLTKQSFFRWEKNFKTSLIVVDRTDSIINHNDRLKCVGGPGFRHETYFFCELYKLI